MTKKKKQPAFDAMEGYILAPPSIIQTLQPSPTQAEYSAQKLSKRFQILKSDRTTSTADLDMYDVPEGKVLFLTNVWCLGLSIGTGVGGAIDGGMTVAGLNLLTGDIIKVGLHPTVKTSSTMSQNFSMPLRLEAKTSIILSAPLAGTQVIGGFCGWLEEAYTQ